MARASALRLPERLLSIGSAPVDGVLFGDLEGLAEARVVALDVETSGLKWGSRVIGISLAWSKPGTSPEEHQISDCYLALAEQLDLFSFNQASFSANYLLEMLRGKTICTHTAPFDLRQLYYNFGEGIIPERVVDVSTLAWMVGPQERRTLKALYSKYIADIPREVVELKEDRAILWRLPPSQVEQYARWDAKATLELYYKFMKLASRIRPYHDLYERDINFTNLVMRLVMRGLPVNRVEIERRIEETKGKQRAIIKDLQADGIRINPDSHEQVLDYIRKHHDQHAFTTEAEYLVSLIGSLKHAEHIVAYRQLSKALGSWYYDLLNLSEEDGRVHSQLHPFGTRSYRMSSDDLNVQAIPMKPRAGKGGIERAFGYLQGVFAAEDKDEVLWQFDLKQAEVRWAGMLSGENALAEVFNSGIDPYRASSKRIWSTEDRRSDAKQATLASIYEIGAKSFSVKNDIAIEEAAAILKAFRTSFPALRTASRADERYAQRNGYIELFDGRRRYFAPDESEELYKAFNQRVQGAVSEHMQLVMLETEQLYPERLLLQIHDSLVMQVPRDQAIIKRMQLEIQEVANEVIPRALRIATSPVIPMLLDSESWQ